MVKLEDERQRRQSESESTELNSRRCFWRSPVERWMESTHRPKTARRLVPLMYHWDTIGMWDFLWQWVLYRGCSICSSAPCKRRVRRVCARSPRVGIWCQSWRIPTRDSFGRVPCHRSASQNDQNVDFRLYGKHQIFHRFFYLSGYPLFGTSKFEDFTRLEFWST